MLESVVSTPRAGQAGNEHPTRDVLPPAECQWNALPGNWHRSPIQFRQDLIDAYKPKGISALPVFDDHLLDALVATAPDELRLYRP